MEISELTVAERDDGIMKRKNQAPVGLQKVLQRLAKLALSNSPCCLYECFAIALESEVDCRTLVELQLAPYMHKRSKYQGDAIYISGKFTSKNEASQCDLPAHHHELGDVQSAAVCQELVVSVQVALDDVYVHEDELTDKSPVLDSPCQPPHDAVVTDDVIKQEGSKKSDPCDVGICHAPLVSCSDNVFRHQLGLGSSDEFDSRQSFSEASQDWASDDSIHTQEANVALIQCTDTNNDMLQVQKYEQLNEEDADCNEVQLGLTNGQRIDQGVSLGNERDGLASGLPSERDHESLIVDDSWYPDISAGAGCQKGAHGFVSQSSYSAEVNTGTSEVPDVDLMWHMSPVSANGKDDLSSALKDPEVQHISLLDCENSKFGDIPVHSIAQHVKLALDCGEMEATGRNEQQMVQDQLLSLFDCILYKTENLSQGFPSPTEFQQNSDAFLGGMELCDDMELIPVTDEKTGTDHNEEGTETISVTNNYSDGIKTIAVLSNNSDCLTAVICASLGGMELCDDMELIPVDDEKASTVHNTDSPESACDTNNYSYSTKTVKSLNSGVDGHTCGNEKERLQFSQLSADNPGTYMTVSTPYNKEQLETVSRDDSSLEFTSANAEIIGNCDASDMDYNYRERAQPGQDKLQYEHVLSPADSSNEYSETTDATNEKSRISSTELVCTTAGVKSVEEMQHANILLPLETIHTDIVGIGLTETLDSAVSNNTPVTENSNVCITKNSEVVENGKNINSTNTGCESTALASHTTRADIEFHVDAEFNEDNLIENHPDLPLLKNEKTSSTVYYASEDVQLSVSGSGQQLEPITVDYTSIQTKRLELDDLTLTVTCFIPEENEELWLDDDGLDSVNANEQFNVPSPSSSRKLPANNNPVISSDKILQKRRSSEFLLSYLMPIDETAEFVDDGSMESVDIMHDKSLHLLQPANEFNDVKTEPRNNTEQKTAHNINASLAVEHAYDPSCELTEKIQQDEVAAEEPSSSDSVYGFGITAITDNGCKINSSGGKEQIIYEESHSLVDHSVDGFIDRVDERHGPTLWISTNQPDTVDQVVGVNKDKSKDHVDIVAWDSNAATNVTQVSLPYDDSNEHATLAEHTTLNINSLLQAHPKHHATNSDDTLMLFAADATQHSSSKHSVVKTAESGISDLWHNHSLDTNAFTQNKVQGISDAVKHQVKDESTRNNRIVGMDTETSSGDEAILCENSATACVDGLKSNIKTWQPSALQLYERPVLQSTNIQAMLDDMLQGLVPPYEITGKTQHTSVEERPLSQMATNDSNASPSFSPELSSCSPVAVVKDAVELEEPALGVLTDFESTLEQLHSTQQTAQKS